MNDKKTKTRVFHWLGINELGEQISGVMEAKNKLALIENLRKKEILFKKTIRTPRQKPVKSEDIAYFSRQLATMLSAGVPLTQGFDMIAKGQKKNDLKRVITDLKEGVSSGQSLKECLEKHPRHFNALYCSLVDAGEKSGTLDIMLQKIAEYHDKLAVLKKKIKNALVYPAAVVSLALIITIVLLWVVVPQFESLFHEFGAPLPLLTRAMIGLSQLIQQHAVFMVLSTATVAFVFMYARGHSSSFSTWIDKTLLRTPIFGTLLSKACVARFSRTFAITYAAGIAPLGALEIAAKATIHPLYTEAAWQIRAEVAAGIDIHTAMADTQVFPDLLIQMIAIGEASGTLESMLIKAALLYEEEVDNTIHSLGSLLEPLIMSILGILVGGLCLAMYLPIFQLGTVI